MKEQIEAKLREIDQELETLKNETAAEISRAKDLVQTIHLSVIVSKVRIEHYMTEISELLKEIE